MPSTTSEQPSAVEEETTSSPQAAHGRLSHSAEEHESRNFLVLVFYQVVMRTGWIFKTESIVMPAVLDTLTSGGPWGGFLRGCLPVLNRFGHSIPPMLFSRRLKIQPRKQFVLFVCTSLMASLFLLLAAVWWQAGTSVYSWMPFLFLVAYGLFFVVTGINNLAFGTLQGKLIQVTRRGRLLSMANVIGAITAIIAVAVLMPRWLTPEGGRFDLVFGFTGFCFAIAAVMVLSLQEPQDNFQEQGRGVRHLFRSAWDLFRSDANFRRLAWVAMAFSCSMLLFPHYQALGRNALSLSFDNLTLWLIVQNTGTALFSLLVGPLADRRGNRLVMQFTLLGICTMPLVAIGLSHWASWGATLYPGVFLFIGLMPVGFKTFNNYTLEICDSSEHPRYLSTLGLCFALPLTISPLLGWVVEATSYEVVFLSVSAILFAGWLMTFRLHEPRHAVEVEVLEGGVLSDEG